MRPESAAARRGSRWTPWIASAGIATAGAAVFLAWPRQSPRGTAAGAGLPASNTSATVPAPVSEARQLVAKAWSVLKPEMGRLELNTADELCKKAAALDPSDAEVWAAWTHVHTWFVYHNLDRSAARYEAAESCAARAMRLDPLAYESRLAQALQWVRGARSGVRSRRNESERFLRALLTERPDEPRALFALGFLLKSQPEGPELLERLGKNPAYAAVAWMEIGWMHRFRGKYPEADAAADRSIAATPYWNNLALKVDVALFWRGDVALALDLLKRMPPEALQEDFGIGYADMVYKWGRKHAARLAFLNGVSKEWLNSQAYVGPRAYLVGRTRLALGQNEAARQDLLHALESIEQRLRESTNDSALLTKKAATLYFLGQTPEAEKAYRLCLQIDRESALRSMDVWFESPDVVIERLEQRAAAPNSRLTAAALRLDPDFDSLRNLPRFQALQAKLDADPRTATPPPAAKTEVRASATGHSK